MNKLMKDFGVRALLATIVVVLLGIICIMLLVFMYQKDALTVEVALSILSATGLPAMAMAAIAFYFGSKVSQGSQGGSSSPTVVVNPSPVSSGSSGGLDLSGIITIFEDAITKLKNASTNSPKQ